MHPSNLFFYGAVFFLFGVLLSSLGFSIIVAYLLVLGAALALLIVSRFKKQKVVLYFIPLLIFVLLGSLYFVWDHKKYLDVNLPSNSDVVWQGIVLDKLSVSSQSQELIVRLKEPHRGKILLKVPRYPSFAYGDLVNSRGGVRAAEETDYGRYLMKERVAGIAPYPEVEYISSGHGSFLKGTLVKVREEIVSAFGKVLPQKEAAFLAGITLGERSEFSKEFKEAMSKSGTTHLVALSGYNITIIGWAAASVFLLIFSRRISFILTILTILGFVVMTGAESSVVRAAIMGTLVLFAEEIGRRHDFRNAIAFAALLMSLQNPKVLLFDIGFELSFLAVIGIIYLKPAFKKIFNFSNKAPGFLSWRENLITTFSAQAMAAPLLISEFGNFSPISLVSNLVVLEFIPITMAFGFSVALLSFLSRHLSLIAGWFTLPLLWFEVKAIEFFGKISIPFNPALSILFVSGYYVAIAYVIFYGLHRKK